MRKMHNILFVLMMTSAGVLMGLAYLLPGSTIECPGCLFALVCVITLIFAFGAIYSEQLHNDWTEHMSEEEDRNIRSGRL